LRAISLQTRSPTTVHHLHEFIHEVLDNAVRLGVIPRNYADYVDAPGLHPAEIMPLTEDQAHRMLAAVAGDRYEATYVLALATGVREAELLGLRWEDIDFARGRVRVAMTLHILDGRFVLEPPKSRYSLRTLPLPDYAAEALRRHRATQEEEAALLGNAWGNTWNLVFTTRAGLPVRYNYLLRHFRELIAPAGLPAATRIHDLRHTFATLLIERGVPIKVVSELLGHSSITITLAIYGHVTPRMRDTALTELNALLLPTSLKDIAASSDDDGDEAGHVWEE
jgi:integrase